jgi:hypothetical protein
MSNATVPPAVRNGLYLNLRGRESNRRVEKITWRGTSLFIVWGVKLRRKNG